MCRARESPLLRRQPRQLIEQDRPIGLGEPALNADRRLGDEDGPIPPRDQLIRRPQKIWTTNMNGEVLRPHPHRGSASDGAGGAKVIEMSASDEHEYDLPTRIAQRRRALTVAELADFLSLSTKQVYELIKQGQIPSYRIGGSIRLDPGPTARWLREQAA